MATSTGLTVRKGRMTSYCGAPALRLRDGWRGPGQLIAEPLSVHTVKTRWDGYVLPQLTVRQRFALCCATVKASRREPAPPATIGTGGGPARAALRGMVQRGLRLDLLGLHTFDRHFAHTLEIIERALGGALDDVKEMHEDYQRDYLVGMRNKAWRVQQQSYGCDPVERYTDFWLPLLHDMAALAELGAAFAWYYDDLHAAARFAERATLFRQLPLPRMEWVKPPALSSAETVRARMALAAALEREGDLELSCHGELQMIEWFYQSAGSRVTEINHPTNAIKRSVDTFICRLYEKVRGLRHY